MPTLARPKPFLIALGIASLCVVWKASVENRLSHFRRPSPVVSLETAQFYSRSLLRFSLGFTNLLADLTWVQLLQGASHEEMKEGGVSWEYAKLRAILDLDRKFPRVYSFGSAFVSIFRRDEVGAEDLLRLWTRYEPLNWQSHYSLAFHLFHEMGKSEAAAPVIFQASQLPGAPPWLVSLGVRLLSERTGALTALQTAVSLFPSVREGEGRTRLSHRVRALNLALQKASWKENLEEYRKTNRREPKGIEDLGTISLLPFRSLASAPGLEEHADALRPLLSERFTFRYDPKTKSIESALGEQDKILTTLGIHKNEAQ